MTDEEFEAHVEAQKCTACGDVIGDEQWLVFTENDEAYVHARCA